MVRSYQPPKQGKVLDRSSIFFARSYLLVLNSSLLHRPFSFYNSSLLPRPFLFFTKSDVLILVNFFVN